MVQIEYLNGNVPDCGSICDKSPAKMVTSLSYCQECSKLHSYGEKFVAELLNQLCEVFEREKSFYWSEDKRYDFYLPFYNCIIEVHGKQHYLENDFSKLGGRTYIEEQFNDEYKKELAKFNGIENYIVIKNIKSDKDDLIDNIFQSLLPIILNFKRKDIDWDKCHECCTTNKTKLICDYYEKGEHDLSKIAEHTECCVNTVKKHLKDGARLGWCDYTPEKGREYGKEKTKERVIKEMSKPVMQYDLHGNFIKEFHGIQQAQRELGINHIFECLIGKRKTAGSFQWRYSSDRDNVSAVTYQKSGKPYRELYQYDKQMKIIKTWSSITEAAEALNISKSSIVTVCKGRRKTAGGFIWKYKEE